MWGEHLAKPTKYTFHPRFECELWIFPFHIKNSTVVYIIAKSVLSTISRICSLYSIVLPFIKYRGHLNLTQFCHNLTQVWQTSNRSYHIKHRKQKKKIVKRFVDSLKQLSFKDPMPSIISDPKHLIGRHLCWFFLLCIPLTCVEKTAKEQRLEIEVKVNVRRESGMFLKWKCAKKNVFFWWEPSDNAKAGHSY